MIDPWFPATTGTIASVGGAVSESWVETYDAAGRLIGRATKNLVGDTKTIYEYESTLAGGDLVTVTYGNTAAATSPEAGKPQVVREYYADGQIASVTGSAVTDEYYYYQVSGNDRETWVFEGGTGSPSALGADDRYTRTVSDMLGRTTLVERSGWASNGVAKATESLTYDASTGNLTKSVREMHPDGGTATKTSATVYQYDGQGNVTLSGMDLNGNEVLDEGVDRINESTTTIDSTWRQTTRYVYLDGQSSGTIAARTRERISGFSGDALGSAGATVVVAETEQQAPASVGYQTTTRKTSLTLGDAASGQAHLVTTDVTYPDST